MRDVYERLRLNGTVCSPRGQIIIELLNFSRTFLPNQRWPQFTARKLNLDYIRRELQWYLQGDPYDLRICEHASIWKDCVSGGRLNSNYGHYWFKDPGIWWVVEELTRDKDSRRAMIPMLATEHMHPGNKDIVCTSYVGFMIRRGELLTNVRMRSQDAIYGLGNDLPAFWFLADIVYWLLKEVYPDLYIGPLNLHVDSFHVYEKHWKLLDEICESRWEQPDVPWIGSTWEAKKLLTHSLLFDDEDTEPRGPFTRWLYEVEL